MISSNIFNLFGMYRSYFIFSVIVFTPHFITAQSISGIQQKIDMVSRTLPVTVRIDLMNEISNYLFPFGGQYFSQVEDSISLYYADQAYHLSIKYDYKQGYAEACFNLAGRQRILGRYQESLDWSMKSLKAFEELKEVHWLAKAQLGICKLYWKMEEFELAKNFFEKASPVLLIGCESRQDSNCVDVLLWQGVFQRKDKNYTEAKKFADLAIKYATKSECKMCLYYAYTNLGYLDRIQGNFKSGFDNYQKAIDLLENHMYVNKTADAEHVKWTYYNIGHCCYFLSYMLKAVHFWKKSEELGMEEVTCDACTGSPSLFLSIAHAYMTLDMNGHAQSYINKALITAKQRGDDAALARGHQLLGGIFLKLEYNEFAIENYQIAASLYEELREINFLGYTHNNIGRAHLRLNQKDKAINRFKQGELIGSQMGNGYLMIDALSGRLKAGDTSVTYQQLIDLCHRELKNTSADVDDITITYEKLMEGYFATHDFANSEDYAHKLLKEAIKLDDQNYKLNAYEHLANINHHLVKYEKAYEFADLAYHLKDSIQEKKNRRLMTEIQFRNQSDMQKEEIAKLNQEKENTQLTIKIQNERLHSLTLEQERTHFMNLYQQQELDLMYNQQELSICEVENNQAQLKVQAGEMRQKEDQLLLMNKESEFQQLAFRKQKNMKNISYAGLGVLALVFLLVRKNYVTNQKLKLHMVRNKIAADLHDEVGGTLSSIQLFSEIAKQQSREVIPMLDTINDSAKKMLDAMTDIVWTINPENDDVEKILDRMRSFAFELMNAKEIEFEFNADEDLHDLQLPMEVRKSLYLIFKESTNNLVKYSDASRVHFSIKEENRNLTMRIQDNGKGFDTSQTNKGNGLNNMKKRAEEIGGHLRIESKQNEGTTITLRLAV